MTESNKKILDHIDSPKDLKKLFFFDTHFIRSPFEFLKILRLLFLTPIIFIHVF